MMNDHPEITCRERRKELGLAYGRSGCQRCGSILREGWRCPVSAGTHVFEGEPDGRQSASISAPTSRFRPIYRALSDAEKALHDEIKAKAVELETVFERVSDGRYKSLAMTSLEESVMWAVKQLTA